MSSNSSSNTSTSSCTPTPNAGRHLSADMTNYFDAMLCSIPGKKKTVAKKWETTLPTLLRFVNVTAPKLLRPVWHAMAGACKGNKRMVLQQLCTETAASLNLDTPIITAGFCQSLTDLTLACHDPMALLHSFSIWLFPDTPLADMDAVTFEERLFDTVVQGATAPDLAEMKKVFKYAKVMVPQDLTQLLIFLEHFTVVCATLLSDRHPLVEQCFIFLQEATENKKDNKEKLKKRETLAAELVSAVQIQTNIYCKSVERGQRTVYPTFRDLIFKVMSDQFLPPQLPSPICLQFTPSGGGGGGGNQLSTPYNPTGGDHTRDLTSCTSERRVQHPQPHLPWKVQGKIKNASMQRQWQEKESPLMDNGKLTCLT